MSLRSDLIAAAKKQYMYLYNKYNKQNKWAFLRERRQLFN